MTVEQADVRIGWQLTVLVCYWIDQFGTLESLPKQSVSSAGSGARPYLSMLRHLRGSAYDSPNLDATAAAVTAGLTSAAQ